MCLCRLRIYVTAPGRLPRAGVTRQADASATSARARLRKTAAGGVFGRGRTVCPGTSPPAPNKSNRSPPRPSLFMAVPALLPARGGLCVSSKAAKISRAIAAASLPRGPSPGTPPAQSGDCLPERSRRTRHASTRLHRPAVPVLPATFIGDAGCAASHAVTQPTAPAVEQRVSLASLFASSSRASLR